MSECNHCWHSLNSILTSDPPKYEILCCWCGEKNNVLAKDSPEMHTGYDHGEYTENMPSSQRKLGSGYMGKEIKQPTETPTVTPEQVAEFQRKAAEAEQAYVMDAAQKVMDFAKSLDVQIIAIPQLAPKADGSFGVVAGLSVQRISK